MVSLFIEYDHRNLGQKVSSWPLNNLKKLHFSCLSAQFRRKSVFFRKKMRSLEFSVCISVRILIGIYARRAFLHCDRRVGIGRGSILYIRSVPKWYFERARRRVRSRLVFWVWRVVRAE